ncbi:enoyl-ACP reductase [Alphaproteobacteria bacterium]|nr:enoyl-ACP reductase [Alphaproteobacteria bacterium]
MPLMTGKRGIVMGVANERSIAWGIAKTLAKQGAEIAFTYQNEGFKKRLLPLMESVKSTISYECDVSKNDNDENSIESLFKKISESWNNIDFVVHALAYSDKEELKGKYVNCSRENFLNSLDISAFSFTRVAKSAFPLMSANGGSLLTLSYLGAERTTPNYNVMGVAKSALEASIKYLAMDLGKNNIRVNAISAGPVKTLAGAAISGARHVYRYSESVAPLKFNPELEEIGNSSLYLLSDMSSGVTGNIHHVDGGLHSVAIPKSEDLE